VKQAAKTFKGMGKKAISQGRKDSLPILAGSSWRYTKGHIAAETYVSRKST
jgi:hypothetical protein